MNRSSSNKVVIIGGVVIAILLLGVLAFVANIVLNFVQAFIPLSVGALLLFGNRRQLVQLITTRQPSTAVLNAMLGLALICFGLGVAFFSQTALRFIFYMPGFVLLLASIPAALDRPSIYNTYRNVGGRMLDVVRRRKQPSTNPSQPGVYSNQHVPQSQAPAQPQTTVRLDPTTIEAEPQTKY